MGRKKRTRKPRPPAGTSRDAEPTRFGARRTWASAAIAVIGALAVASLLVWSHRQAASPEIDAGLTTTIPTADAAFVGSAACADCHADQYRPWQGSQHALAMQAATEESVLGDFSGVKFPHMGVTSEFFRRDAAFMVRTDGPDGRLVDYKVKHTFGIYPLQQYLLELPGGRLQALSIAWDARPREAGGQRWFHLYPGERIERRDELHWTRRQQNWNFMCADCHSTNLQKNYDASYRHLCHELERDQRRLRGLPRPRIGARAPRRPRPRLRGTDRGARRTSWRGMDHRSGHGEPASHSGPDHDPRTRRLRAMSLASRSVLERLPRRRTVPGSLSTGVDRIQPLPS
jgi:cytochrome c553